jgi:hypothetical protein
MKFFDAKEGREDIFKPMIANVSFCQRGYYELKKHKPWFDERCSKLLDQRKQAKLQWLQDPSKRNKLSTLFS